MNLELNLLDIISLGTGLSAVIVSVLSIRSTKRKNAAEADTAEAAAISAEAEADKAKFESYTLLINDLNDRFAKALTMMRTLEDELQRVKKDNGELSIENTRLKSEVAFLKQENSRILTQNKELRNKLSEDAA